MGTQPQPAIALALAGGGPMGGLYELGTLLALQQALPQLPLQQLPMYVGVSAGSVIAAALANRLPIKQIADNLLQPDLASHPVHPALFYTPAWQEYRARLAQLPTLTWQALCDYLRHPCDESLLESLTRLKRALPAGFFDSAPIESYLRQLFEQDGISNDFRTLAAQLLIVAADLDCGRSVVFGQGDWADIAISKAVQASICVPGLYTPVQIRNHYFIDGILYKTVHASAAFDAGADLVICINPIVPFVNRHFSAQRSAQTSIIREGTSGIISQAIRAMVHSRSATGFRQYQHDYPDKDLILFEPKPDDADWFFTNEFSFKNRVQLVQKAYVATLADLQNRLPALNTVLLKYGLELRAADLQPQAPINQPAKAARRWSSPLTERLQQTLKELASQYPQTPNDQSKPVHND